MKKNQVSAYCTAAAIYKNMAARGINCLRFTAADLPFASEDGVQFQLEHLIHKIKYEALRNKKVGPDFTLHRWHNSPNHWMLLKAAPEVVVSADLDPSQWRSKMLKRQCNGDCNNCHPKPLYSDPMSGCRGLGEKQRELSSLARSMSRRLDLELSSGHR